MKVPIEIGEDAFIPMEAADLVALHEQKRRRNDHWARLKLARLDLPEGVSFPNWMQDTWGVKLHMSVDGMITDEFSVVDESKYTMYLIKYSQ